MPIIIYIFSQEVKIMAAGKDKETDDHKCNVDLGTVNFRLSQIEDSIKDLRTVVLETKLQERDIKDLSEQQTELLQAINAHDARLKTLEQKPTQEKAAKWQYIMDFLFKVIVAAAITYVLSKLGISVQ